MLWGGRNTANKYHWHVWGVLAVWAALGLSPLMACAFLVCTAQSPGCSTGELFKMDPGLRVLPRFKPLRFRFLGTPQRHRLGLAWVLCPSQVRTAQVTRCLASTLLPGGRCLLSLPWSQPLGFLGAQQERHLRCALCLLPGANLWLRPSWRLSTIQDPRKYWLATGSLLAVWWRMPFLGPKFPLAFQLWLSPACLSASGGGWASLQPASSPLVFAQSSFVL